MNLNQRFISHFDEVNMLGYLSKNGAGKRSVSLSPS